MDSFNFLRGIAPNSSEVIQLLSSPAMLSLILAIILLFVFRYSRRSTVKIPPGNLGFPFIGETIPFLRALRSETPQTFFNERMKKFGHFFLTSVIGQPIVVLYGAAGNRLLLFSEDKLVQLSSPEFLLKLIGKDSLLSKREDEHRILRTALAHFLWPQALQSYMGKMSLEIQHHINEKWKGKEELKMLPLIRGLIFSIACSLFFAIDNEQVKDRLHNLLETILVGSVSLPLDFPGTSFRKAVEARSKLDEILSSFIKSRRSDLRSGIAPDNQDLLTVFLTFKDEGGNPLRDEEILDNFSLMLHASYETSVSPTVLMFKILSSNPECYETSSRTIGNSRR